MSTPGINDFKKRTFDGSDLPPEKTLKLEQKGDSVEILEKIERLILDEPKTIIIYGQKLSKSELEDPNLKVDRKITPINESEYDQSNWDLYRIFALKTGMFSRPLNPEFLKCLKDLDSHQFCKDEELLSMLAYSFIYPDIRPSLAISYFSRLAQLFPKEEYFSWLGFMLIRTGDLSKGKACYLKALKLCNSTIDRTFIQNLGKVLQLDYYQEKYEDAAKLLNEVLNHHPTIINCQDWSLSELAGDIYAEVGKEELCEKFYKMKFGSSPKEKGFPKIEYDFKWFQAQEKFSKGQKCFDSEYNTLLKRIETCEHIELPYGGGFFPREWEKDRLVGKCQRKLGLFDEALITFKKLKDDHEIAKTLYAMGDYSGAFSLMKEFMKNKENEPLTELCIECWTTWEKIKTAYENQQNS